jgi:tetratricopeptide (TPR) repeat protein
MALMNRLRLVGMIAAAVLLSVAPVLAQTGGVTGKCLGTDGKKLVGYPIVIQRLDINESYKTKTDKKGEYVYIGLPPGGYKVIIDDRSGHQLYYQQINVGIGDPTPLNFDLSKVKGAQQKLDAIKAEKSNAALMQAFNQANTLYEQKQYDAAAAAFAKAAPLAKGKNLAIVQAHIGMSYYQAGEYDKAVQAFQQAVAGDPTNKDLHGVLANAYVKQGDIKDAAKEYKAAGESVDVNQLKNAQNAAKSNQQIKNLKQAFDAGNTLYNQGQYAQAAADFQKAIPLAKAKNLTVVLSRLADSYDKAKEYPQAVGAYQKAMANDPTNAQLVNSLGSVYAHMGNIPQAYATFQKAAQMDPTHAASFYFNMGAVMLNTGKMDDAAASFKKSAQTDPTYRGGEASFREAQALLNKATSGPNGQVIAPPGTIDALKTYLKESPSGPYADQAKQMLQALTAKVQTNYKKH